MIRKLKRSPKMPKDLGLKIGTKDLILWENVAKEARVLIDQSENNLKIQTAMLKLAEEKIAEEKKFLQT